MIYWFYCRKVSSSISLGLVWKDLRIRTGNYSEQRIMRIIHINEPDYSIKLINEVIARDQCLQCII
jgi:hypothetical protein